jgi:Cu/Ag efflux protein CusF
MLLTLLVCLTTFSTASAQQILRGTLKKLDIEAKQAVIEVDGKEKEYVLTDETRVLDATGDTLAEKLKGFTPGTAIFLRPEKRGDRDVLTGLRLVNIPGGRPNAPADAPREIQQGVIKAVDVDGRKVTITVGDKDLEVEVTNDTQFRNLAGESLAARLAELKKEMRVAFVVNKREERYVLVGIMRSEGAAPGRVGGGTRVSPDHSSFKPLTELGQEKYHDFTGGLYPDGKNDRPAAHEQAGLALAKQIQPLNNVGKPDAMGKIVLLSVGMSNTSQISNGLQAWLGEHQDEVNPGLQFVNGAQGGMTAEAIQDPEDGLRGAQYWRTVDERLEQAGVTRAQVQAVWIKEADAGPTQGFPGYAKKLQGELLNIVQVIATRFPNCRVTYLSSRTYGGFATTGLNPEPVAYESGFAVKWLIEEQLKGNAALNFDPAKGAVKAPWLSWGPYLWANGATKRSDGFSYEVSDFSGDGTHHASGGQRKTAELLGAFLLKDSTSRGWFGRP